MGAHVRNSLLLVLFIISGAVGSDGEGMAVSVEGSEHTESTPGSTSEIKIHAFVNAIHYINVQTGVCEVGVLIYPSAMNFKAIMRNAAIFQANNRYSDHFNLQGTFFFNPKLDMFPFDTQTIRVEVAMYPVKDGDPYPTIGVNPQASTVSLKRPLPIEGFALIDTFFTAERVEFSDGAMVQTFALNLVIRRHYFKAFIRILLPPLIILMLMLFTFSYPSTDMMTRLAASASAFLSMTFVTGDQFALTSFSATLSISDSIDILCYSLILFSVLFNVILMKLQHHGKDAIVYRISVQVELVVWILSPILFCVLVLPWWAVFLLVGFGFFATLIFQRAFQRAFTRSKLFVMTRVLKTSGGKKEATEDPSSLHEVRDADFEGTPDAVADIGPMYYRGRDNVDIDSISQLSEGAPEDTPWLSHAIPAAASLSQYDEEMATPMVEHETEGSKLQYDRGMMEMARAKRGGEDFSW